jgi:peptidoglycan/LPS O-acetylase OafA/YrhL
MTVTIRSVGVLERAIRTTGPATELRSAKGAHVPELDGLRGLAALAAVAYHCLEGPARRFPAFAPFQQFLQVTPFALDTFFVLSGFLIGGILLRSRASPTYYRTFYMRRAYRILPVYYVWIGVYLLLYSLHRGEWGLRIPDGHSTAFIAASFLLFFQNFFVAIIESTYIMAPAWTLAVEEHFYLLAPPLVRRLSRRHLTQVLWGIVALGPVVRFAVVWSGGSQWGRIAVNIWTPCRFDALALGILLAIVWQSEKWRLRIRARAGLFVPLIAGLTLVGFVLLHFGAVGDSPGQGLALALARTAMILCCLSLILFALAKPASVFSGFLRSTFMRGVGRISYCLYLVHWGVIWMISRFVFHASFFGESLRRDLVSVAAGILISLAIAKLSWRLLEGPLLRRAHARYQY